MRSFVLSIVPGFTSTLADFYEEALAQDVQDLEIIFISSDSDEESFVEYFGVMPWTAVPYDRLDSNIALAKKYEVKGVPTLIILNGINGEIIDNNGRSTVTGAKGNIPKALDAWKV